MLQTLLFSLSQVFSKPRYIALSIVTFAIVITLAIWLPNINFFAHTTTSETFTLSQKIGIISSVFGSIQTNFTPFSRIITILISFLFAINISFFTFYFLRAAKLNKEAGIGTSAFLLGMIGVGCATCGSVILSSFLGVGATIGFLGVLPLRGQEFGLLSIVLLSISIYFLSKKIKDPLVCNTKPITFKSLLSRVPVWIRVAVLILIAFIIGILFANQSINKNLITKEA